MGRLTLIEAEEVAPFVVKLPSYAQLHYRGREEREDTGRDRVEITMNVSSLTSLGSA